MALSSILEILFYIFLVSGSLALVVSKVLKRKVKKQTINIDSPYFPVFGQLPNSEIINHTKENNLGRKGHGLILGNQRQRRKKFRQSKYLFNKYGL